jgi:MYXO-CTERM domain-containing protein
MATDPEELLRSIERTREEVAHTVDTIAGRLDPKKAAQRGAASVRDRLTDAGGATRSKLRGAPRLTDAASKVRPYAAKVPKPAVGAGLAALVALAAVLSRRRRH